MNNPGLPVNIEVNNLPNPPEIPDIAPQAINICERAIARIMPVAEGAHTCICDIPLIICKGICQCITGTIITMGTEICEGICQG